MFLLSLLFLCLHTQPVFSQEEWFLHSTIGQITCIAHEGASTIWIGTGGGVAQFDGTTRLTFQTINSSLPFNDVRFIGIYPTTEIKWFCTGGGGLVEFRANPLSVDDAVRPEQ